MDPPRYRDAACAGRTAGACVTIEIESYVLDRQIDLHVVLSVLGCWWNMGSSQAVDHYQAMCIGLRTCEFRRAA